MYILKLYEIVLCCKHFLFSWKYILHSCIVVYWVFVTPPSWPFGIFGPVRSARSTYRQRTAARRHGRFELDMEMCFNRFRLFCFCDRKYDKLGALWAILGHEFHLQTRHFVRLFDGASLPTTLYWRQSDSTAGVAGLAECEDVWRIQDHLYSIAMSDCDDGKKHEQQFDNHQFLLRMDMLAHGTHVTCTKAVTDVYSGNAFKGSQT